MASAGRLKARPSGDLAQLTRALARLEAADDDEQHSSHADRRRIPHRPASLQPQPNRFVACDVFRTYQALQSSAERREVEGR